jgi:hypothetical protein
MAPYSIVTDSHVVPCLAQHILGESVRPLDPIIIGLVRKSEELDTMMRLPESHLDLPIALGSV